MLASDCTVSEPPASVKPAPNDAEPAMTIEPPVMLMAVLDVRLVRERVPWM
jgi:hypothetical protein